MTAYGAVISLQNTIRHMVVSSHFTLDEPSLHILQLAYNELQPLQEILEGLDETRTSRSRKKVNALDGRIKHKIWEFEDKLESLLRQQILPQTLQLESQIPSQEFLFQSHETPETSNSRHRRRRNLVHKHKRDPRRVKSTMPPRDVSVFSIDLHSLQDDVDSFIISLKEMEKEYIYELGNMPQEPFSTTIGFDSGLTKSKMIGLSDQFQEIKGDLKYTTSGLGWGRGRYLYPLGGMAGIGKTTLAKEIYEDADIVSHFDCRAWVTVTRTMVDEGPHFDEVLRGIDSQLCGDESTGDYLKGKTCLIVLDDVWETQVLDSLLNSLEKIKMGSVVILYTTRGIDKLVDSTTTMRFLNEEESKDLLCHKVFGGKEFCPPELDKAATKIAKKCEGLPLLIVTVADALSKSENTDPDYWEDVAEERNSVFTDAYNDISEVLFPSYDYLPQYLKMPFLSMGVFPPDYDFPPSKLINMFIAEGWFLHTNEKSLEDSVRKCLYQLSKSRYLLLFERKSTDWDSMPEDCMYKTCRLHSSWRHVCKGEARKTKFYHVLNRLVVGLEEDIKGQRGLCLQNNMLFGIKEFYGLVRDNSASTTRSLLFFGPYHQYPTPIDVGFRLLRELDALQLRFYTFPTEILTLVQLKYLALTCNGELPSTISKLFNLRVLIVHPHMNIRRCGAPSYVPKEIWDMKELEHIEILGKSLQVPNQIASLEKLLTLVGVNANIGTISELSRRIPNVRKLGVRVELTPCDDHNDILSMFRCISTLQRLKTLKCSIVNPVLESGYAFPPTPGSLRLPRGLKKLHLSGMGFPLEYMDVIGSLPHLEVLKLRSYAFRFQGSNWVAQDSSFFNVCYVLIEDSDLVYMNLREGSFCNLSYLSLKHCYKLKGFQWVPSHMIFPKIELVDCNPLAFASAEQFLVDAGITRYVVASSSYEEKPKTIKLERISEGMYKSEGISWMKTRGVNWILPCLRSQRML